MSTPEALGYAVCLDARGYYAEAAELRRQHAEIERLTALAGPSGKRLGELERINDDLIADNERLTAKPNSDWRKPTAFRERFAQAVALLCGTRAPADMIDGWIDDADDRLQGFAAQHGPAWAQGIVLLDAAHVLAATPTDGVDHEAAAPAPAPRSKADRVHAIVDAGPYPGMSAAFDAHMGAECWTDPAYRQDAATWAAAWKAAVRATAAPAPHPDTADAERYRWLREHGDRECTEKDGYGGQTLRMGDDLDDAIDAARTEAHKGE